MDNDNAKKMERRLLRKRNGEKERADDPSINNNYKTNKISQENIIQSKQKKKKRKLTLKETSNDSTIDKATSKEDSDENVKIPKKPSKRQLKKEKAIQVAVEKRQSRKSSAMQKALHYVSMWKHSRNEWKFEKLKQIWLIDNLLDENSISEKIFPIVLEYFEGCKGMAREVLLRKGMEVIRKAEEETDEDKKEIMKSIAYKRARELLQALPTDK